jgi:hypothetical protein
VIIFGDEEIEDSRTGISRYVGVLRKGRLYEGHVTRPPIWQARRELSGFSICNGNFQKMKEEKTLHAFMKDEFTEVCLLSKV